MWSMPGDVLLIILVISIGNLIFSIISSGNCENRLTDALLSGWRDAQRRQCCGAVPCISGSLE